MNITRAQIQTQLQSYVEDGEVTQTKAGYKSALDTWLATQDTNFYSVSSGLEYDQIIADLNSYPEYSVLT